MSEEEVAVPEVESEESKGSETMESADSGVIQVSSAPEQDLVLADSGEKMMETDAVSVAEAPVAIESSEVLAEETPAHVADVAVNMDNSEIAVEELSADVNGAAVGDEEPTADNNGGSAVVIDEWTPGADEEEAGLPATERSISEEALIGDECPDKRMETEPSDPGAPAAGDASTDDASADSISNTNNNSASVKVEKSEKKLSKKKSQSDDEKRREEKKDDGKPKRSREATKYWALVDKNRQDFASWTQLIAIVEKEGKPEPLREVYDEFLLYYPFCYGYWKKLADYVAENGGDAAAEKIYEDGIVAVGLSIDLWVAYLEFYISNDRPEEAIRALFERCINTCGLEFKSDKVWDMYIDWEVKNDKYINITQIYRRLLSTPTKCYTTHYDNVKEHIDKHEPWKILSTEELIEVRVRASHVLTDSKSDVDKDMPPGTTGEELVKDDEIFDLSVDNPELMNERLIAGVRIILHEDFKSLTDANEKEVKARWSFEEAIKRPYFHSKPLDSAQLKNWRRYLDYEIAGGGEDRAIFLFERCVIACAQYEEFWLKYTTYLEGLGRHIDVRNVYTRACRQHLPYKASIHITWAFYEERQGDFEQALSVIDNIELQTSDNMCVLNHKLNLLRRHGDDLCDLFSSYLNKKKLSSDSIKLLTSKYARYLLKIKGDPDKASEVLTNAITKYPTHEAFYTQLLDVEYQRQPLEEDKVLSVFDLVNTSSLSAEVKQKFHSRRYEFVDDLGSDVNRLYTMHQQHEEEVSSAREKKRALAATTSEKSSHDSSKKARTSAYSNNGGYSGYQQSQYSNTAAGGQQPYYGAGATADWNSYYQQSADYSQYQQYPQTYPQHGYGAVAGGYTGYDYTGYY